MEHMRMQSEERNLSRLVEMAKAVHMSDAQKAEQRNSFVYGNTKIENSNVTREMVESISKSLTSFLGK